MKTLNTRRVLQAVARQRVPEELNLLPGILARIEKGNRPFMKPKAKLIVAGVIVLLALALLLASVPGAANAMKHLFGYIPDVGIVEQGAPIRVLAEPVSVAREGISITVTSAILSGDRTHIDYRIFGVPGSAYPRREDVMGCMLSPYLRLPNGRQLASINEDFPPIPAEVNEVVFVMPCILDTLPGKAPTDWELPLKFKLAPPDLTMMPVIELPATPQATMTQGATVMPAPIISTPNVPVDNSVTIVREIETSDGYILVGQFAPRGLTRDQVQLNGDVEIREANGKKVAYTFPYDIAQSSAGLDPNETYWYAQFKAAGLAYPLTITFSGFTIQQADPSVTAEFTFDAGSNPQPGQEWTPKQDIQIAEHTLRLDSIMVDSRNGYSFRFQCDPDLINADLEIVGYKVTGWGGGGDCANGTFDRELSYEKLPSGVLTIRISNLTVAGDSLTWKDQWSPATPRTDLPANPTPQPGLCLTADTVEQLERVPEHLASGKALVYEQLEGSDQWGLVLYNLADGQKRVVTSSGNWGALSTDGRKVAYSASDNTIHIVDVDTQAEQILQKASGFDLHWSPDGKQIAYVALGGNIIDSVFIISADGTQLQQVSGLSYEVVIGWSPDGSQLYFVAPFTGGAAWKLYSFDLSSGATRELFTIENGTPTFLNPKLSPDGKWVAYRGRDSSSLYLVRIDGSETHLMLENVGVDGIEWLASGWLGVSLMEPNTNNQRLILVSPDSCEAYRLLEVGGEMEGLFIP